jgi:hypothetical protein
MDAEHGNANTRITLVSNASAELARTSERSMSSPDVVGAPDDLTELDPDDLVEDDEDEPYESPFDERWG